MTKNNNTADRFFSNCAFAASQKLGLYITQIHNDAELDNAFQRGLCELYQDVFSRPPYCESFTQQEVMETFRDCLHKSGTIFTAIEWKPDGKVVAFVSSIPAAQEASLKDTFANVANDVAYFAEDGVHIGYRRLGVSATMKDLLLAANEFNGYGKTLLRTSIHNYKQILAVSKAGGRPLSNVFQDVKSTRQDGTIKTDRRGFFMFEGKMNQYSYVDNCATQPIKRMTIARPGGNDTAIVWDQFPREAHRSVAERIQTMLPGVEQVMFVEPGTKAQFRGQMAGGEFCGNATRSLGYMLLDGKHGKIDLEISGTERIMSVEVSEEGAKTSVPVLNDLNSVELTDLGGKVILDGISFLAVSDQSDIGQKILSIENADKQKEEVISILNQQSLSTPACGILITKTLTDGTLYMDPFVYVRSTGTVYYESACGSGSTALGMIEAAKSKASVSGLKVQQPSGMSLIVRIERDENAFITASVSGPIEILLDEKIRLPRNSPLPCYTKAD